MPNYPEPVEPSPAFHGTIFSPAVNNRPFVDPAPTRIFGHVLILAPNLHIAGVILKQYAQGCIPGASLSLKRITPDLPKPHSLLVYDPDGPENCIYDLTDIT
jgi:hypothetical protein